MFNLLLATTILCELAAAAAVLLSIRFPARRIWPPDSPASWKNHLMGFLFLFPSVGIGILGMMDWGSVSLPSWCRIVFGIPPLLGGLVMFSWAAAVLGFGPTFGCGGPLTVGGPFRLSRNPQYAGCILMLIGWTLLTSSPFTAVASFFGVIPLALVPLAEEPWLREKFGVVYDEYRKRVPRFL